jgi:hypothetical protein
LGKSRPMPAGVKRVWLRLRAGAEPAHVVREVDTLDGNHGAAL